ncbi:hypothetical protein ACGFX8_17760 [Streptomyces sp. NPDC048362]|uniref:hypothetical protein n=1 Tax=Streptomyces sp. NPDC048362 TaxID=3365539 RepID=UPI00371D5F03
MGHPAPRDAALTVKGTRRRFTWQTTAACTAVLTPVQDAADGQDEAEPRAYQSTEEAP